jgi:putative effector of murein hydrolase
VLEKELLEVKEGAAVGTATHWSGLACAREQESQSRSWTTNSTG